MATEAKSIDMTMTEVELETELRYKLFDALVEDYDGNESVGKRNNKIQIDSSLLNREEFLFGCKGKFYDNLHNLAWFFYFVDKIVIIYIPNDGTYRNVQEYFKVYKYGSNLNYISIYDVAKIVFRHLTAHQLERQQDFKPYLNAHQLERQQDFKPYVVDENTINFSLDLDLDIDKLIYSSDSGCQGMQKWFNLGKFQFEQHTNNGYIVDVVPSCQHRGSTRNIIMTIRSHIRKMIKKNDEKRMQKQLEDSSKIQSQLEEQISIQGSQLSDMNALILRMQSQMEEQSKIILEQQSNMKGILTNMLRDQSTRSEMDTMSRQLEEQSKLIESLQLRDKKKKVEQDTLESEIDMILNGEI